MSSGFEMNAMQRKQTSAHEEKEAAKEKQHFLLSRVIQPERPTDPIERVEIEAFFSKAVQVIAWRELKDESIWRQGWA